MIEPLGRRYSPGIPLLPPAGIYFRRRVATGGETTHSMQDRCARMGSAVLEGSLGQSIGPRRKRVDGTWVPTLASVDDNIWARRNISSPLALTTAKFSTSGHAISPSSPNSAHGFPNVTCGGVTYTAPASVAWQRPLGRGWHSLTGLVYSGYHVSAPTPQRPTTTHASVAAGTYSLTAVAYAISGRRSRLRPGITVTTGSTGLPQWP